MRNNYGSPPKYFIYCSPFSYRSFSILKAITKSKEKLSKDIIQKNWSKED